MVARSQRRFDALTIQYAEISKELQTFIDWRHNVLSRYAVIVGAIIVAANTFYKAHPSGELLLKVGLFLSGVLCSMVAIGMDVRNTQIILHCYDAGCIVEDEMHRRYGTPAGSGIVSRLDSKHPVAKETAPSKGKWLDRVGWNPGFRYRRIMVMVYGAGVVGFTLAAIVACLRGGWPPKWF
jgi:hypothetical protein